MSAAGEGGEWEAEHSGGRGIVVHSNGGFPPPVPQTHHVTCHGKKGDEGQFRGRLVRPEAEVGFDYVDWRVNQSNFPFLFSKTFPTAVLRDQIKTVSQLS